MALTNADEARAFDLVRAWIDHDHDRYEALLAHALAEYECAGIITGVLVMLAAALDHLDRMGHDPEDEESFTELFLRSAGEVVALHLQDEERPPWLDR